MLRSKAYKRRFEKERLDKGNSCTVYVLIKKDYAIRKSNFIKNLDGSLVAFTRKCDMVQWLYDHESMGLYDIISCMADAQGKFEEWLDE